MNIAFIPAKGTSSRVPGKNLRLLGDKSLVQVTLEFAENLGLFDQIYLSTDSVEIVESATCSSQIAGTFAKSEKGELVYARNKLYVHKRRDGDSSLSARTVAPLLDCLRIGGHTTGNLTILQPTSPFRLKSEYVEILTKFSRGSELSLISVKEVRDIHPLKCFQLESDGSVSADNERFDLLTSPVQDLPKYYAADGAYYLTKIEYLVTAEEILAVPTMTYSRQGIITLNIDTMEDLKFAKTCVEANPTIIEFAQD